MEISTSALPTVAAERATMFVALELSKSIWLVALHSPISDKVSQHRFAGGDVDGLLALIARKQAQAEAGLGAGLPVALAIPVALRDPIGAACAVRRPDQVLDLQLHQAMRGGPAKHAPGAGPGKRVTGAGTRTTSRKATEEGEVYRAPAPNRPGDAENGVLRDQARRCARRRRHDMGGLHAQVQAGTYRALPSRRSYIPKEDGSKRPLAVAALEDKIVQRATAAVLSAIYEEDFLGFSYGFRPGRSQHDALDALIVGISTRKVNFILDADIRSFFTEVSQERVVRFLGHRIGDKCVIRLVQKWLRAGVDKTRRGDFLGQVCASPSDTRGRSRVREFRSHGSVRGAVSNGRPYREPGSKALLRRSTIASVMSSISASMPSCRFS